MTEFLKRLFGNPLRPPAVAPPDAPGAALPRPRHGAPLSDKALPRAAIVILNYNGRHHLERCFASLQALDYPPSAASALDRQWLGRRQHRGDAQEARLGASVLQRAQPGLQRRLQSGRARGQGARGAGVPQQRHARRPAWLRELVGPIVRGEPRPPRPRCTRGTAR